MNKPTIEEIETYLTEKKHYPPDEANLFADQFWNFYESKGWLIGKTPMKSWTAAIRTWELKQRNNGNNQQPIKENTAKAGTSAARVDKARKW